MKKIALVFFHFWLLGASTTLAGSPQTGNNDSKTNSWEAPHLVFTQVSGADRPVCITHAGDGSGRVFFAEQGGAVRIIGKSTPFLNINPLSRSGVVEIGGQLLPPPPRLVSVAFPSAYTSKRYFYVSYYDYYRSVFIIARYSISADPDVADATSGEVISRFNSDFGCNGGQILFAPDGTLYLNPGGPVANAVLPGCSQDLDSSSGKMLAILNEKGQPLPQSDVQLYWPFNEYFGPTDCSVIGGEFDASTEFRMRRIYFYGDASGSIWGLKPVGTNWVKLKRETPMFDYIFGWEYIDPFPPGHILPLQPPGGSGGIIIDPNAGIHLTNIHVLPITNFFVFSNRFRVKTSGMTAKSSSLALATEAVIQLQHPVHTAPLKITAFGRDEAGHVYVANYGAGYWVQKPPPIYSAQVFTGGGIFRIDDDPLKFTVTTITNRGRITLSWQSIPGVTYRIHASFDQIHWLNFPIVGTGGRLSIANLPESTRSQSSVIAVPPVAFP